MNGAPMFERRLGMSVPSARKRALNRPISLARVYLDTNLFIATLPTRSALVISDLTLIYLAHEGNRNGK